MMRNRYIERRKKMIEAMAPESICFMLSGQEKVRNGDITYDFEVERNFFYMTGIDEAGVILVLIKTPMFSDECLYIPRVSEKNEIISGITKPFSYYQEISGIHKIAYKEAFETDINTRMSVFGLETVYFAGSQMPLNNEITQEAVLASKLRNVLPDISIKSLTKVIKNLRRIKDEDEIGQMKKAIALTKLGIEAMLKDLRPGKYEYQLQADFEHAIKYHGARALAFPTIVAAGANSNTIHYLKNSDILQSGETLLVDLGADYGHYAADISRTFPIDGHFTEEQAKWYNICLKSQEMIIRKMQPGTLISDSGTEATAYVAEQLVEAGLASSTEEALNMFYKNMACIGGVNHELGLDTHDNLRTPKIPDDVFKPGMVYTVEPGIYLRDLNLGIRIEDDVLVTESGPVVLSADIPKTVEDLEAWIRKCHI